MTGSHEVTGSIPVGSTTPPPQIVDAAFSAPLRALVADVGLLLFEDDQLGGFGPLLDTRPAFELRVGCLSLRERLELALPGAAMEAIVRPQLRDLLRVSLGNGAKAQARPHWIAINARAHGSVQALRALLLRGATGAASLLHQDSLLACWGTLEQVHAALADTPKAGEPGIEGVCLHRYPWDLLRSNERAIDLDAKEFRHGTHYGARSFGVVSTDGRETSLAVDYAGPSGIPPYVQMAGAEHVLIGSQVQLKPGVVLDAEGGSIVLASGARIGANATLVGPCYVGPSATVNPGAKLREGTSVGRACKVGGEIEESIFLDFSNKQHDGFLGHAVVGSWVNLGADTNASDLKNNYGSVRVDYGGGVFDSGERFVGPIFGDHAKTGINSMLTTGTSVGVCANVFGAGFPSRHIPNFAWGGAGGFVSHDVERAIETARIVMARRSADFLPEHEALLRMLHASSCS